MDVARGPVSSSVNCCVEFDYIRPFPHFLSYRQLGRSHFFGITKCHRERRILRELREGGLGGGARGPCLPPGVCTLVEPLPPVCGLCLLT